MPDAAEAVAILLADPERPSRTEIVLAAGDHERAHGADHERRPPSGHRPRPHQRRVSGIGTEVEPIRLDGEAHVATGQPREAEVDRLLKVRSRFGQIVVPAALPAAQQREPAVTA